MKILVIGAKAAGMKAACRAKRLLPEAEVTVLDEGEHISLAACGLPYFLSGDIDDFKDLLKTSYDVIRDHDFFAGAKGVKVVTGVCATGIDPDGKSVTAVRVSSGETVTYAYDELLLATGARPVLPSITGTNLPGVSTFTRASDAMDLRQAAARGKINKAAVVGAGFIGCELCESFRALWGIDVTLFEREAQVLPEMLDPEVARIVELELRRQGVACHLNSPVREINPDGDQYRVTTGDGSAFDGFDRVIFAAGVKPRSDLAAAAGVELGAGGGIVVDRQMRTNIPHIFAAGDCVQVTHILTGKPCYLPLGSLANRMGRVAGNVMAGKDDAFAPVTGASCVKVFDVNVAAVGFTARKAREEGFEIGESWGVFSDRADYYPEAENISAKMVFDRETRRVLGVQAVSKGDAVRRIDATSALIAQGATLSDLRNFEPAYAPPYATALDPLHYLAYIGIAELEEGISLISPLDFESVAESSVVLDVREPVEVEDHPLEVKTAGLHSIPFTELRGRLDEVPRGDTLSVVCAKGVRSSEALRLLKQNGFDNVRCLGGGLLFFQG